MSQQRASTAPQGAAHTYGTAGGAGTEVARRPGSSQSPARAAQGEHAPSPPRMQVYYEKVKPGETEQCARRAKLAMDWMGVAVPTDAMLRQMFDHFDTDRSGLLDKNEMRAVVADSFENYGAPMTPKGLDRLFSKFDRDNSGKLNFDEFAMLILARMKL